MANLNRVFLLGNCTKDPVSKTTTKGTAITELSLAVNRVSKDENGDRREEVLFVEIVLFGKVGEVANRYLKRGSSCMVEGRLRYETWQDKQSGAKRSKLTVIGENLQRLGDREQEVQERPEAKPEITENEFGEPSDITF
jgi:single-strand DNA-binding protein